MALLSLLLLLHHGAPCAAVQSRPRIGWFDVDPALAVRAWLLLPSHLLPVLRKGHGAVEHRDVKVGAVEL